MNILRSILLCLSLILSSFTSLGSSDAQVYATKANDLPITNIHGSYVVNPHNTEALIGMVDYVFVGKVTELNETQYKNVVTFKNDDGTERKAGTPYTVYTIEITENIKGSLPTENPIVIAKKGGLAIDEKSVYLFENDVLPQVGCSYVFLAYAQKDGSLLVSGANSNILIEEGDTSVIDEYRAAYENEIPYERPRYTSIYEVKPEEAEPIAAQP